MSDRDADHRWPSRASARSDGGVVDRDGPLTGDGTLVDAVETVLDLRDAVVCHHHVGNRGLRNPQGGCERGAFLLGAPRSFEAVWSSEGLSYTSLVSLTNALCFEWFSSSPLRCRTGIGTRTVRVPYTRVPGVPDEGARNRYVSVTTGHRNGLTCA